MGVDHCVHNISVAQDGVRDRLCAAQYTLAPFSKCLATRGSLVKRPPGATRVGLLPRSNTRRTVTLDGASGPLVATNLIMMTGPVSGRTASQMTRPTLAEVEVVENRDRYHGRVATDNATSTALAHTTCDCDGNGDGEGSCTDEAGRTPSSVE